MTFIGEKSPQPTFFGKWKEHWICNVGEILEVLEISVEPQSLSGDVVGTRFKVNRK